MKQLLQTQENKGFTMSLKHLLPIICSQLLLVQSVFGASFFDKMSPEEQKTCGIEKLSPEEKTALDAWVIKQTSTQVQQPVQVQSHKILHGEFAIASTVNLGRFITLDNGITYDIPSRSRKKTMAWKVGDTVRLVEPVLPTNYKLENLAHKQTIGAKIATVKSAPKESITEPSKNEQVK